MLDRLFEPLPIASPVWQLRVVTISCSTLAAGTGSTTEAIARRLGTAAACVSVDISEPTRARRARADREGVAPTFICADTQIRLGRNP